MIAAGLVAQKARALDQHQTLGQNLFPGSRVVTEYYKKAGLLDDLAAIGFTVVGYGVPPVSETQDRWSTTLKMRLNRELNRG